MRNTEGKLVGVGYKDFTSFSYLTDYRPLGLTTLF